MDGSAPIRWTNAANAGPEGRRKKARPGHGGDGDGDGGLRGWAGCMQMARSDQDWFLSTRRTKVPDEPFRSAWPVSRDAHLPSATAAAGPLNVKPGPRTGRRTDRPPFHPGPGWAALRPAHPSRVAGAAVTHPRFPAKNGRKKFRGSFSPSRTSLEERVKKHRASDPDKTEPLGSGSAPASTVPSRP